MDSDAIALFCQQWHIQRLAFFGSVLGDAFGPDSDIDVLVEFEPGQVIGLRFVRIQDELSRLLGGRRVDLVTYKSLNSRLREQVLSEAELQYARP